MYSRSTGSPTWTEIIFELVSPIAHAFLNGRLTELDLKFRFRMEDVKKVGASKTNDADTPIGLIVE